MSGLLHVSGQNAHHFCEPADKANAITSRALQFLLLLLC